MTGTAWWETVGDPASLQRWAAVALLVSARVAPLAWIAVHAMGARFALPFVAAMTGLLGAAFAPMAAAFAAPPSVAGWAWLWPLARELVVGSVFAAALAVPFLALGWAGQLGDRWRGAWAVPPTTSAQSPLETLYRAAAAVVFVASGGHRLLGRALAESFRDVPVGLAVLGDAAPEVWLQSAYLVIGALRFAFSVAAPVALAVFVVELAFGMVARVAPQFPTAWLALPLRAGLGLTAAALSLFFVVGRLPGVFQRVLATAGDLVERLGG